MKSICPVGVLVTADMPRRMACSMRAASSAITSRGVMPSMAVSRQGIAFSVAFLCSIIPTVDAPPPPTNRQRSSPRCIFSMRPWMMLALSCFVATQQSSTSDPSHSIHSSRATTRPVLPAPRATTHRA